VFQKKIKQIKNLSQKKGFIGAIGDDLPSLVPIFFSLLIFFGTLAFVFVTLGDRNAYLEKYFESISISKEVLGSSFYSGYVDFDQKVKTVNTTEKFAAGLIYNPDLLGQYNLFDKDYFIQSFDNIGMEEYRIPVSDFDFFCTTDNSICNSNSDKNYFVYSNDPDFQNVFELDLIFKNEQPQSYLYPVVLSTNDGVFNVYLYVIVW
jgi:hypothetical protein